MSQNRKRRANADEKGEPPNSNLMSENGFLQKIVDELKEMRKEIKEGKEENEKKLEELKLDLKKEIAEQNLKIEQRIEEKLSDLKNEILKLSEKEEKQEDKPVVPENDAETTPKIPIRQAVLGEWKLVGHENWEVADLGGWTSERFSRNLKFELRNGKLMQSGGGYLDTIEGEDNLGRKFLYLEDNHLKTIWDSYYTEDISVQNGRLHYVENSNRRTRFYEKI